MNFVAVKSMDDLRATKFGSGADPLVGFRRDVSPERVISLTLTCAVTIIRCANGYRYLVC